MRNYSPKTLDAYRFWIRKFQVFVRSMSAEDLGGGDVKGFLTDLAVRQGVAASTQNQAFNALLLFYRHVLGRDSGSSREGRGPSAARMSRWCFRERRWAFGELEPRYRWWPCSCTAAGCGFPNVSVCGCSASISRRCCSGCLISELKATTHAHCPRRQSPGKGAARCLERHQRAQPNVPRQRDGVETRLRWTSKGVWLASMPCILRMKQHAPWSWRPGRTTSSGEEPRFPFASQAARLLRQTSSRDPQESHSAHQRRT